MENIEKSYKQMSEMKNVGDFHICGVDSLEEHPAWIKAKTVMSIRSLPPEAFGDLTGLKHFCNGFTLLNICNEMLVKDKHYGGVDAEFKAGMKSTKSMLKTVRKDLEKRLKIKLPENVIFTFKDK